LITTNDTSMWNLVFIVLSFLLIIPHSSVKWELSSDGKQIQVAKDRFRKIFDKFGIKEIYPTKSGGREWYLNIKIPKDDRNFSVTFNHSLTRQADGS